MFRRTVIGLIGLACCSAVAPLALQAGVDEAAARYMPWSGSYWPIRQGLLIRGPLRKYDRATGRRAADWELKENPPLAEVPDWYGYCHAWAAAAVMDREPVRSRSATGVDGVPMGLGIGDQKGMLTACHTDDQAQHYGIRYEGESGQDPQDIYPDQLWHVLRLYVKQRGMPLILDIEAGPEVWNYPVYAYRVAYRPTGQGNEYFAEMSLWMADDAVPPDIVGVQVSRQTYYFTFQLQGGSALLGSGRWAGPSQRNHPDFAWFPYIVRAENPEVQYHEVKRLVGASGSGPSGDGLPSPDSAASTAGQPLSPSATPGNSGRVWLPPNSLPGTAGAIRPPPNIVPGTSGATGPASSAVPGIPGTVPPPSQPSQPCLLSPVELLRVVTNRTSQFTLDITVDKFDGGQYAAGEVFTVKGASAKAAYLYLFYIDSRGELTVLFPPPTVDNRIPEQRRFQLPGSGASYVFRTFDSPGTHRIKAVATSGPLAFSSLAPATEVPGQTVQVQKFHLPPSQKTMFQEFLTRDPRRQPVRGEELGGGAPQEFLGEFGQDEVAFYVGP